MVGWFVDPRTRTSAALPLPAAIVNAYQGILPTYLYAFQFPVSTIDRNAHDPARSRRSGSRPDVVAGRRDVAWSSPTRAWVWRLALAERPPRHAATRSGDAG